VHDRLPILAIRAAPTAGEKIDVYAGALAAMGPRTAPIFRALRDAAARDPACAALHAEIVGRRAANMAGSRRTCGRPASCARTCPTTPWPTSSGA
jgi:hypothetical protein